MNLDEKKEKLLVMFETRSNDCFKSFESTIRQTIDERYDDDLGSHDVEKVFDMLIQNYVSNLWDDLRWVAEEFDEYEDLEEQQKGRNNENQRY